MINNELTKQGVVMVNEICSDDVNEIIRISQNHPINPDYYILIIGDHMTKE